MSSNQVTSNFFVINRSLIESDAWKSEAFTKSQAWIDLIGLARFSAGFGYKRGVEIPLERGQLCWSEVKLAERWKWSRGKTKRFISALEVKQQIVQQNTNVTTLITITNYNKYQLNGTADNTANGTAESQQTEQQAVQQTDTKEECKDSKEGNNEKKKPAARFVPPSRKEVADFFADQSHSEESDTFFDHFESNGWKVGGKAPMKKWQSAAMNWIRRADKSAQNKKSLIDFNQA